MALITKIRRNFWAVLLLIGLALAAFLIMDVTSGPIGQNASANLSLGTVNGENISYNDFQITEGTYFRGSQGDVFAKRQNIWDFFVEKTLINNLSEDMGVSVSRDELMDLQFGAAPSPIISQNWANQQQQLAQIKASIENDEEMNSDFRMYWAEQEKQIIKTQKQSKIANMVNKAIYSPSWMAEATFKDNNTKVDFNYVKIPFDAMTEEVSLTDADFQSYITKNADRYTVNEETRNIKYAVFDVIASNEDSTDVLGKVNAMKTNFQSKLSSREDSLFVAANGGAFPNMFLKKENLPEKVKLVIDGMAAGEIYGPYVENGAYNLIKLREAKNVPDTISAQHILRRADPNNAIQMAAADKYVDSLMVRFNRGQERFDSLAVKNSQDSANAFDGGKLPDFTQGQMVPEFNNVCFNVANSNGVYKVKTQYGVHMIKINRRQFNDEGNEYNIALVGLPIIPSSNTQNERMDGVSELIIANKEVTKMEAALSANGVSLESASPVKANDFRLDGLGTGQSSRDIIKWAFDPSAELGDVSQEVYGYTDEINYYDNKYVIAVLAGVNKAGLQPVSALRSSIEAAVRNDKKAQAMVAGMNVTSLDELASTYGSSVATATDASLGSPFIEGIGSEGDVVSVAYATPDQAISKPIIGKSGVFVVQPLSKSEAGALVNMPGIKSNLSTTMKSQVSFQLIESLKKKAKIEDLRSTYF